MGVRTPVVDTGPQLVLLQCLTLASPGQGLWRCQEWACDRVVRKWWCLVGLHSYLTFSRRAAAGPFVCGCETERLQPVRGRWTQIKYVIGLTDLDKVFRHSWYQSKKFGMADRRDWGGGGDDPEESTQCMIERIWESLTNIRRRMDQQASVPPVAVPPGVGETVPIAPIPPGVEVPFVAPLPPPVLIAEEPVMQVEKFLRLQPPTYSGGPNPDTAEHWVHEIERVFMTMWCPATDKVVLAAYQLRGFALEWWRLKMQTTFAGRTEEAIAWSEFLDVFNDTFFPIQVQQVKREQFRTLQQGLRVELHNAIVPLMCKTVEEAAQRVATLERSIRTRQVDESDSGSSRLPQQSAGVSKGKAPAGPSPLSFGKWGQKLKQAFKGKGRGWGGRQQFQQGRGRPEVEESQQSTVRQPIIPPGYRCHNCNQPRHLIRNFPYPREYGNGRGVQQQPQQFQQPPAGHGRGVPQQRGRGRVMAITRAQAEASNMIEEFLDCMVHPLKEESCELVVEVPSGLKQMKRGDEDDMAIMPRGVTSKEVLESFMGSRRADQDVQAVKGINLQKLVAWTIKELPKAEDDEKLERVMKGFATCLAGALLFPSVDNVLEEEQLSAICGIWEGERLGPAVLAFLYNGLTPMSLGKPRYDSMLLFTCWVDLHFKFDVNNEAISSSRIFFKSLL
ncbi:hypothetical protein Taro_016177 [Colocasia esculenta]|uniref:Retrotransposon gag domain-containing protein n=1 Tax=Colocasia esculenta TaxID=4460 RepID=A0A843UJY9_COLES|nr:hypothetical protein [Colocasia esculenta]